MHHASTIKLVIFDVAGTIIEDHGEVLSCFARALRMNGIRADENALLEWKGASKREVIRHFIEQQPSANAASVEQRVERAYRDFCRLIEDKYEKGGVVPTRRAADTFDWLTHRGIAIATTTGFHRALNNLILDQLGWRSRFSATVCSSDVPAGRPAPYMIFRAMKAANVSDVNAVVNVGDTPLDLQAGTNAGVRGVVGVLTGAHSEARLRREPHTHIVANVAELPFLLVSDFGVL
jgi:phosphonatase-like hydrolase